MSLMFGLLQTGGAALVLEAEATAALQSKGIAPTDDSYKYIWNKVLSCTVLFYAVMCAV